MRTDFLLYYFLKLLRKGDYWYRRDINGSRLSRWPFSWLQGFAIFLAGLFVYTHPQGMAENTNVVDFILSSLSITTALLFGVVAACLDRARQYSFTGDTEEEQRNGVRQWNHLYQFTALTINAIFWALIVVFILVTTMLFGHSFDLSDYVWVGYNGLYSLMLFILCLFVLIIRFVLIFSLLNFFILLFSALLSLFASICSELELKKPQVEIPLNRRVNVSVELRRKIGCLLPLLIRVIAITIMVASVYYVLCVK